MQMALCTVQITCSLGAPPPPSQGLPSAAVPSTSVACRGLPVREQQGREVWRGLSRAAIHGPWESFRRACGNPGQVPPAPTLGQDGPRAPVKYDSIYVQHLISLFIHLQREEKGGRKRGRRTSMCERNIYFCLLHAPHWGPGPQPSHVP